MKSVQNAKASRHAGRIAATIAAILLASVVGAVPARADERVAYYTVASSHQGRPENLRDIAARLLGDSARATEIYNLNAGRRQPDGHALSDPDSLRAGWHLVLPWDAAGSGVRHGVLPTEAPAPTNSTTTTTPTAPAASPDRSEPSRPGGVAPSRDASERPALDGLPPSPGQVPTTPPSPPTEQGECVTTTAASGSSDWAMARIAADLAWPHSRGHGQLVAIVDSGVDGRSEQLSGRVAIGANIVTGDGRGDSDCLGTGTAMAGLVAAEAAADDTFAGVAPEAVVMPVQLAVDQTTAEPAVQAAAIEVAVSAGATVIALGAYADATAESVADAIRTALSHDVVVVAAAPVRDKSAGEVEPPDEVIVVGGIGVDGMTAQDYLPAAVDVVAPGVNVSSIGVGGTGTFTGSGTELAVALVAGVAALVRSAHPGLTTAQVAHRVAVTSDKMGDVQPDPRYGYGMVNPEAAVVRELPEEVTAISDNGSPGAAADTGAVRFVFLITLLAALVLSGLLIARLRRAMRQADDTGDGLDAQWPQGRPPDPVAGHDHRGGSTEVIAHG
ncbi:S8 family serine peptidase [Phytohabitans kaempferiae]|uniref:S8 family serine peptidase n=1 Tax=Phytohabitans kaempferiae TaxID=1620943 RepID=A0ABV6M8N3_9ACTN